MDVSPPPSHHHEQIISCPQKERLLAEIRLEEELAVLEAERKFKRKQEQLRMEEEAKMRKEEERQIKRQQELEEFQRR